MKLRLAILLTHLLIQNCKSAEKSEIKKRQLLDFHTPVSYNYFNLGHSVITSTNPYSEWPDFLDKWKGTHHLPFSFNIYDNIIEHPTVQWNAPVLPPWLTTNLLQSQLSTKPISAVLSSKAVALAQQSPQTFLNQNDPQPTTPAPSPSQPPPVTGVHPQTGGGRIGSGSLGYAVLPNGRVVLGSGSLGYTPALNANRASQSLQLTPTNKQVDSNVNVLGLYGSGLVPPSIYNLFHPDRSNQLAILDSIRPYGF